VTIPDALELVILSLAVFRVFRLLAYDVITRPMRIRWITHRAEEDGTTYVGPGRYRPKVDEFWHCPWCMGFWLGVAWWACWQVWPGATLGASVPLAMSAIVGLVTHNLDK